jgi:hypothetical protein
MIHSIFPFMDTSMTARPASTSKHTVRKVASTDTANDWIVAVAVRLSHGY